MFSKTFDITESPEIIIECPYCELEHSYQAVGAESKTVVCQNDMRICGQNFIISVSLLSRKLDTEYEEIKFTVTEAVVSCRKIEGCSRPALSVQVIDESSMALRS